MTITISNLTVAQSVPAGTIAVYSPPATWAV